MLGGQSFIKWEKEEEQKVVFNNVSGGYTELNKKEAEENSKYK